MKLRLPSLSGKLDRRDLLALVGCGLLGYGLERILPGAGYAAVGAVLIGIAILLR